MSEENITGQDENGLSQGQESDGQNSGQDISELINKLNNVDKVTQKWASEMGEVRQVGESVNDLLARLSSIEEKLSSRENEDLDFDPYDKNQQVELIRNQIVEELKPIQEVQQRFLTNEQLAEMLQNAQIGATVQTEFKLTPEEFQEIDKEAKEQNLDVRLLAWEKYGERKFGKNDLNKKLSKELKKSDNSPPLESAAGSTFDSFGLPSDPRDFEQMFKEKGPEEMRKLALAMGKKE